MARRHPYSQVSTILMPAAKVDLDHGIAALIDDT
jgi:hypothetical protein